MQVIDAAHEIKDRATGWFVHATNYFEARWNLGVLDASEKVADAISSMASALVIGTAGVLALLFASLGAAWLIGDYYQSPAAGYFSIALFYVLVCGVLFFVKDTLIKVPVINAFIKKFYYEN
ncbi:MAG: hypothetical protein R2822_04090 [Spirosomataceae bacterium]